LMKIDDALSRLEDRFISAPANYVVEAEIAFELKRILNEELRPAELHGQHDAGKSRGSIPDHSEYADAIVSTEEFDRVHCEVSGATFGFASEQRRLDLVIFDDEVALSLEDGSKKFRVEDVLTAVELKFIKNAKYLREGSKRYHLIAEDIDRLDSLPGHVDTYCLIFSNFGFTQREDTKAALETLKSRSPRVEVRHTNPLSGSVE